MKKRLVLLLVTAMAATTVLAGCGSKVHLTVERNRQKNQK